MPPAASIPDLFAHAHRLHTAGDLPAALEAYAAVLAVDPWHPESLHNIGVAHRALGRVVEAELALRRALDARPDYPSARRALGSLLQALERLPEAARQFEQVLAALPEDVGALIGLAHTRILENREAEARPLLARAARHAPGNAVAQGGLGALLAKAGEWRAALPALRAAVRLNPGDGEAMANLGIALKMTGDLDGGRAILDRALPLAPQRANTLWNIALLALLQGRYRDGWEAYECRWQVPGFPSPRRTFAIPPWRGEPVAGKRVLVYWEQGFGDTMQFARFLPRLKARGATVLFECQRQLFRLFQGLPGVDALSQAGSPPPEADYVLPLLSLPLRLDLPEPFWDGPTVAADPALVAAWAPRLPAGPDLKVGVVWAGSATHAQDHHRSVPFPALLPLLSLPGVRGVGLQLGAPATPEGAPEGFVNLGPDLKDFADTAAVMAGLDVVITVDTSVAHLAGALGKPVWVMLPPVPDWRWLMGRQDTPWYPSARLFRAAEPGDWDPVIARLRDALTAAVARGTAA